MCKRKKTREESRSLSSRGNVGGGTVKGDTQTTNKLNTFDYLELD